MLQICQGSKDILKKFCRTSLQLQRSSSESNAILPNEKEYKRPDTRTRMNHHKVEMLTCSQSIILWQILGPLAISHRILSLHNLEYSTILQQDSQGLKIMIVYIGWMMVISLQQCIYVSTSNIWKHCSPPLATLSMVTFFTVAIKPRLANITNPANTEVAQLIKATITASLEELYWSIKMETNDKKWTYTTNI